MILYRHTILYFTMNSRRGMCLLSGIIQVSHFIFRNTHLKSDTSYLMENGLCGNKNGHGLKNWSPIYYWISIGIWYSWIWASLSARSFFLRWFCKRICKCVLHSMYFQLGRLFIAYQNSYCSIGFLLMFLKYLVSRLCRCIYTFWNKVASASLDSFPPYSRTKKFELCHTLYPVRYFANTLTYLCDVKKKRNIWQHIISNSNI